VLPGRADGPVRVGEGSFSAPRRRHRLDPLRLNSAAVRTGGLAGSRCDELRDPNAGFFVPKPVHRSLHRAYLQADLSAASMLPGCSFLDPRVTELDAPAASWPPLACAGPARTHVPAPLRPALFALGPPGPLNGSCAAFAARSRSRGRPTDPRTACPAQRRRRPGPRHRRPHRRPGGDRGRFLRGARLQHREGPRRRVRPVVPPARAHRAEGRPRRLASVLCIPDSAG